MYSSIALFFSENVIREMLHSSFAAWYSPHPIARRCQFLLSGSTWVNSGTSRMGLI